MSWLDIFNLLDKDNHVDHDEYIRRLKICSPCQYHITTDLGFTQLHNCELCGCFNLKKAQLKEEKGGVCPDNPSRWKKPNLTIVK